MRDSTKVGALQSLSPHLPIDYNEISLQCGNMFSESSRETTFIPELPPSQLLTDMTPTRSSTLKYSWDTPGSTGAGAGPIMSSHSADHIRFGDTRHIQEGVNTIKSTAAHTSSGVQTSLSDSNVVQTGEGQRSSSRQRGHVTANLHHIGKELFFPVQGTLNLW